MVETKTIIQERTSMVLFASIGCSGKGRELLWGASSSLSPFSTAASVKEDTRRTAPSVPWQMSMARLTSSSALQISNLEEFKPLNARSWRARPAPRRLASTIVNARDRTYIWRRSREGGRKRRWASVSTRERERRERKRWEREKREKIERQGGEQEKNWQKNSLRHLDHPCCALEASWLTRHVPVQLTKDY